MKKMNNKGFSLVELIVVVLIMAIIAVALAPQVMKWVENSRKSNDIENYNALIEAANVAGTNEDVLKNLTTATVTFDENGVLISNSQLSAAMAKTLPDIAGASDTNHADKIKVQGDWPDDDPYNGGTFSFTVSKDASDGNGIKITKVKWPDKNFS